MSGLRPSHFPTKRAPRAPTLNGRSHVPATVRVGSDVNHRALPNTLANLNCFYYVPFEINQRKDHMDWDLAIRRNREDLLKIIAMIFMTIGLIPGAVVSTLPRRGYYAAKRILRPAESAVRRVIFMGMRRMSVPEYERRPGPTAKPKLKPKPRNTAGRAPAFPLIDIRKTFDERPVSDATGPWASEPFASEEEPIDAKKPVPQARRAPTCAGRSAGTGQAHGPA